MDIALYIGNTRITKVWYVFCPDSKITFEIVVQRLDQCITHKKY